MHIYPLARQEREWLWLIRLGSLVIELYTSKVDNSGGTVYLSISSLFLPLQALHVRRDC
jgi:hypothetical protein